MTTAEQQNIDTESRVTKESEIKRLEQQFRANMMFFKMAAPSIYEEYRNYQPSKVRLVYNQDGYINLEAVDNEQPLYARDPQVDAQKSVKAFINKPKGLKIPFAETQTSKLIDLEKHIHHFNRSVEVVSQVMAKEPKGMGKERVDFMLVLGIGLGYHIPELIDNLPIQNICVIEPNPDYFYFSLFTLDWIALYNYFNQEHRTLNLIIGQDSKESIRMLRKNIAEIGPYNIVKSYIYTHQASKTLIEEATRYINQVPVILSHLGYYDDERVSLAHTAINLRKALPLLTEHANVSGHRIDKPVLILGNGPSLDQAAEFIKANQNKAILVSCGSTLGTLQNMGIKPDIHIEQERPKFSAEWLKMSTTEEFRKGITCIGLNCLHPEVFDLFERRALVLKPNDLGKDFASSLLKPKHSMVMLPYCNPTVTNAGAAIVAALGFTEIYFFGVDYGYTETGEHHSKASVYGKVHKDHKDNIKSATADTTRTLEAAANFGGKIKTNQLLNSARWSLEELITNFDFPHYYNPSSGAKIKGASPIQIGDIKLDQDIDDKSGFIQELLKTRFSNKILKPVPSDTQIKAIFQPITTLVDQCLSCLKTSPEDTEQRHQLIDALHELFRNEADKANSKMRAMLVAGSIESFNALLKACLVLGNDTETACRAFDQVKQEYICLLTFIKEDINQKLMKPDHRTPDFSGKFDD